MDAITVLMTGAGSPGARGYIYGLHNNGEREIRIIGTDIRSDIDADSLRELSGFYVIPRAGTEEYLASLVEICKTERIQVILPLNTAELVYLSERKQTFRELGVEICVMDPPSLRTANNKIAMLESLRNAGVRVPDFAVIHTIDDFVAEAKRMGYPDRPLCIKRPDGNGGRGVRFLDASVSGVDIFLYSKPASMYISYEDLTGILPEVLEKTDMLLMEYIDGKEYSVDSLVNRGKTITSVCRRVDIVDQSIDLDATVEQRQDIMDYCALINSILELDGCVGYGIKIGIDGNPMILEINPRLQATTILSVMAGVNFPYYAVKTALGEPVEPSAAEEGIRITQRKQKVFYNPSGELYFRM